MLTTFYTDMLTTSLKLPGRVPCLNQSVKPLLTSLWPLTFYSLNTSACREGPLLKTKGISLTLSVLISLSLSLALSHKWCFRQLNHAMKTYQRNFWSPLLLIYQSSSSSSVSPAPLPPSLPLSSHPLSSPLKEGPALWPCLSLNTS